MFGGDSWKTCPLLNTNGGRVYWGAENRWGVGGEKRGEETAAVM